MATGVTPLKKTCDLCRKRKTKCDTSEIEKPLKSEACASCARLGALCTYTYVHKQGGRPLGSRDKTTRKRSRKSDPVWDAEEGHAPKLSTELSETETALDPLQSHYVHSASDEQAAPGCLAQRSDKNRPQGHPNKHGTDFPYTSIEADTSTNIDFNVDARLSTLSVLPPATETVAADKWSAQAMDTNRLRPPTNQFYRMLKAPELDIEDVVDWSTITFFASLYLKYNHALSPIVHKPSFAHDLATRRDKRDRQFRSFLLGLVTYTIGQSPITRMSPDYTRRELETIQDCCHRASLILHDQSYRNPELSNIATLIYAYFHCQCNSDFTRASVLLASACALAQLMKLDEVPLTADLSQDFREQELRKRVFWYLYAIDVTSACGGLPLHMSPSISPTATPLEVDDDLITTQGAFPQPLGTLSIMTGFVAMVKLHIITGDALTRRRFSQGNSPRYSAGDVTAALHWINATEGNIDELLAALPHQLAPVQARRYNSTEEACSFHGMQRANILITALAAKFVLYDYRQDLLPTDMSTLERRDEVAKTGIEMITSIPQDDLASNGESMRNKVFRIVLALMSRSLSEGTWGRTLQDWWDLYMNIQFVSIASAELATAIPSRAPTPAN